MAGRDRASRVNEIMNSWVEAEHVLDQLDVAQDQYEECRDDAVILDEKLKTAEKRIVELEQQWVTRFNIGGEKND